MLLKNARLASGQPVDLLVKNGLIAAMGLDKKSVGASLRVIVLDEIGVCRIHFTDPTFFCGMSAC